jgi:hypothetical protein
MNDWTVSWAMWGWGILFFAMVVFEFYTLWWNRTHKGKRANLTAYVSAFFRAGSRRLRWSAGPAVLIALFVYFVGHFLEWWG